MYRLEGLSAAIREAVPPALTDLFALLTVLGDPKFLVGVVALLYWVGDDRRATTRLVGYTLVAVAVTVSLKEGLALPRPPAEVRAVVVEPGSHGFPSGHAVGATAIYGGYAAVSRRFREPRVVAAVTALVALIGLSRVVIGAHYLGDVLAGYAVGGLVLAGLSLWTDETHLAVCLLAAVLAVPGVVVTGGGTDAVFALGASLGAATTFGLTDPTSLPSPDSLGAGFLLAAVGFAAIGGVYGLLTVIEMSVVTLVCSFGIVCGALLWPATLRSLPESRALPG